MNVTKLKRGAKITAHEAMRILKRFAKFPQGRHVPAGDRVPDAVSAITWFHRIDLGNGVVTPSAENTPEKLSSLGIPERLDGLSVLDIGAWDGFFSFEAERRGARRVLATDYFCWGGGGWGSQAGFDFARRALGSKVEDQRIDVLDHSPQTVGLFDLVFFFGVLYHMRHPLLALERVASVTKDQLILETHVDMLDCKRPAMAFYPGSELNLDPTNWCGPNRPMVEAMLKTVGFRKVVLHSGPHYYIPCSPRMVFHAWK